MSDVEVTELFSDALSQAVADGASPDEIESALSNMEDRVEALRIARGEQ